MGDVEVKRAPTRAAGLKAWWVQARRRPGRLRPSHLPVPLRILAIVTWIAAGITLLFGFATDWFKPQPHDLFDGQLHVTYAPLWPLMIAIAIGSGAVATGFVFKATRRDAPRHHVVLAWCTGVAVPLIPVLLLALNRTWLLIPITVAWIGATAIVVCYVHVRHRAPNAWIGLLLAGLVAATWLPVSYVNLKTALTLSGAVTMPANDLLDLLIREAPTEPFVVGVSVAFIAVMTAAGVALTAHARSAATDRLRRRDLDWHVPAALSVVALAIIAIEVSGVGGLNSGFYKDYWSLRGIATWPHAIIVAAFIAYGAQRSWRKPLQQRGDVSTTIIVGVSALATDIVVAVMFISSLIVGAIVGSFKVIAPPSDLDLVITWLAIAALIPAAVRPAMRDTAGQWVARVALLYLVPVYGPVTSIRLGHDFSVTWWASPAQVAICLTVIGCAATLLGIFRRRSFVAPNVASRLVIIPLLIVAGTSWLPTFITTPLTPVIAIAAALVALLWTMPPVAADQERHSGVVLTTSAQLLVVTAAAVVVASHPDFTPGDPTMALLFFSVPLSALLCARVTSAPEKVSRPGSPPAAAAAIATKKSD